jgi:CHAD domain-containing protein
VVPVSQEKRAAGRPAPQVAVREPQAQPPPEAVPHQAGPAGPQEPPAAHEVLRAYLAAQSSAFLTELPRLRQGKPEAAHRVRIACRRSRSMLRTYRPLLDAQWADELSARIAEFTDTVAPERDVEVVRERLLADLDRCGPEQQGANRARSLLERMLQRDYAAAHESTLAVLAGPRFHALADSLALAPQALPTTAQAAGPAPLVLYPLVAKAFEAQRRRITALPPPLAAQPWPETADDDADGQWHRARIAVKRCRYAAEVCVPVAGEPAAVLVGRLAGLAQELGVQQDAVICGRVVRRAAEIPRITPPTAFVLGRLLGEARAAVLRSRLAVPTLWEQAAAPELRAWLGIDPDADI